jgi:hypothetical protein
MLAVALNGCSDSGESRQKPAPSTLEDVKRQTKEAIAAAEAYTAEQRRAYQDKIEASLRQLDGKIGDLEVAAKKAKGEARVEKEQAIGEIQQKRAAAARKLEMLKSSSQDAWAEIKVGLDAAIAELEKAYERAKFHFE